MSAAWPGSLSHVVVPGTVVPTRIIIPPVSPVSFAPLVPLVAVPPRTPSHSVPLSPDYSISKPCPGPLPELRRSVAAPSPLTHPSAVAEAYVAPDRKKHYASPDGLGQVFSFDIMLANFDVGEYRTVIDRQMQSLEGSDSSTTWVLSNHDVGAVWGTALEGMPNHEGHAWPRLVYACLSVLIRARSFDTTLASASRRSKRTTSSHSRRRTQSTSLATARILWRIKPPA